MNTDEINDRAWESMKSLTDSEVLNHELLKGLTFEDVWEARIYLRDAFYNDLYRDLKEQEQK